MGEPAKSETEFGERGIITEIRELRTCEIEYADDRRGTVLSVS